GGGGGGGEEERGSNLSVLKIIFKIIVKRNILFFCFLGLFLFFHF
ncbi:hypothetical protein JHR30_09350, partial [Campylobacter jejuni]|nr:hypothetical protein [Campylobacter jejuni]